MAIARNPQWVIDCPEPAALATFYAKLFDWETKVDDDGSWAEAWGDGGALNFQAVEDYHAPKWPSQDAPQQSHLDVFVDDLDAAEAATVALGATKHEVQPGKTFRVFLDPAGHPFCLCQA
ncbi:VOC family protein [Nocardioides sp. NPDC057767]|uniref:VOC family protein n=1 Tax=unclassified Nocardioides TaxID=2615069 RepID=UPI003672C9CF